METYQHSTTSGLITWFGLTPCIGARVTRRFVFPVVLLLFGLALAAKPAQGAGLTAPTPADVDSVVATGPELWTSLEDRVEIQWFTAEEVAITSTFHISRDGDLLQVAASSESIFEDYSTTPNVGYEYCVKVVKADGSETDLGCEDGGRVIGRPTGFQASDGLYEDHVLLTWSDRSEIEAGFNIYRDSGNALLFDGKDDWVETDGIVDLTGSYTFEFWARRASTGTEDFVINLEVNPNGDPVDVDVEIGFLSDDRFAFGLGTDQLITVEDDTGVDWHHWAVAYDVTQRRRLIYRDGVRLATDVVPNLIEPTGDLEFGRRNKQGPTKNRGHFHGALDEVRFWDRALTEAQVRSRMSALLSGGEPGLMGYWPMDVLSGLTAPDFVGDHSGSLIDMDPFAWVISGVSRFRGEIGADLTSYVDRTAVIGFMTYTYDIAAYEDVNGDSVYAPETDFESEERTDTGWRAFLTPPGDVAATDGQHNDKIVITWIDLSAAEEGYRIYRNGSPLGGNLPLDTIEYEDLSVAAMVEYEYCVVAFANGVESISGCDLGIAGVLPPPLDVMATHGDFDDRVTVSWTDQSDSEDGFEVFRDSELLATVDADAEEFSDQSAEQGVEYEYCVQAFSKANPLDPAYSAVVCAGSLGMRAIILDPTDLTATYNDFEDRVELAWASASTTVMVFMVYRDGALIEVLDFNFTAATDIEIPSDTDIEYCVSGGTVVSSASKSLQGQVAQILQNIHMEDAVRESTGGSPTPPQEKLAAAFAVMGLETLGKDMATAADGFYESNPDCETGSRSLIPPLDVQATDDEFESHVEVTWRDSSQVEGGYMVYRKEGTGSRVPLDTLSADRTTYGDYTGASGVRYEYSVETFDDYGHSAVDSDMGQRTLEPPSQLAASDGDSETIVELRWQDNSTAEKGYRIYRKAAGPGPFALIDSTGTNEPAFTDTPPASLRGTTLEYTVEAFDGYGESESDTDDGFTMIENPLNVNASDVYEDEIVVVWVDQSNVEDGYRIKYWEVGRESEPEDPVDKPAGTTVFVDDRGGLETGAVYKYCVTALLNGTESDEWCDEGALFQEDTGDDGGGGLPPTGPQRIIAEDPLTSDVDGSFKFGTSVAVGDGLGLVGAPGADSYGVANLYTFDGDNAWALKQTLEPSAGTEFGHSVGLDGAYAVMGDPDEDGGFSAWEEDTDPNDDWISLDSFTEASGSSVANAGAWMVVGDKDTNSGKGGALICNPVEMTDCSSAPVLEASWTTEVPDTREANAAFGTSVGITLDNDVLYAIVGAPGKDTEKAYIFACDTGVDDCTVQAGWSAIQKVTSSWSEFGTAVAIYGDLAVIGAPAEQAVWIWERSGEDWSQAEPYRPSEDTEGEYDFGEFGAALAIQGNRVVIGAPGAKVEKLQSAGAIYVYDWEDPELTFEERYDARTGGEALKDARFGASVDLYPDVYLIGAPGDDDGGAAYAIPYEYPPSSEPVFEEEVDLDKPGEVAASDGTAPDRIQVRWSDESDGEDGHLVYRSIEGGAPELLTEVSSNIEFYDDMSAGPGEAYKYCIAAFKAATDEVVITDIDTTSVCDIGWRPPNGTIAGIVATNEGGGTADAEVCLTPSPNRAMILDGVNGFVEAPFEDVLDEGKNFTIEAWIRPHIVSGEQYVVSKDSAWSLALLNNGDVKFTVVENDAGRQDFVAPAGVVAGSWYHLAARKGEDADVTLFVNGTLLLDEERSEIVRPVGDSLTIGRGSPCSFGPCLDNYKFFRGEIDEVRIWGTERTDEQIRDSRFDMLIGDEEHLRGYWPLDEGLRRVAPDLTESANHGELVDGIYQTDEGGPLNACATTGNDGNYSIQRIRYSGEDDFTEFKVDVSHSTRAFEPSFRLITLSRESPVQNQVLFADVTAFTVAGVVQYEDVVRYEDPVHSDTLECPVQDIGIFVSKGTVVVRDELKVTTRADGSYEVAVDPSKDANDPWYIIPSLLDQGQSGQIHTFDPENVRLELMDDTFHVDFNDELRHTLSGHFSGGDPTSCGKDIGVARIRVWTQDGCYDRFFEVASDTGAFALDLPPLKYLVRVDTVRDAPAERQDEISEFFEKLGAVEVDLTQGDVERDLIYRAPLTLRIDGFSQPGCNGQITQQDEDGNVLRALPEVPTIAEYGFVPLTISVVEDYGDAGSCLVEEGSVDIYDAIADRVDADSTMQLGEEPVEYTTFGASPNIFSGARIGGVDRSFQKPITVVAHVEGRQPLTETKWAIVEGYRERSSTFISAITEKIPLLILHDPPGSTSYAFREKGKTTCKTWSIKSKIRGGLGVDAELRWGYKAGLIKGTPFVSTKDEFGGGFHLGFRIVAGVEVEAALGFLPNYNVCVTNTETFTTSADPGWVGEDIHVGVALNLIFAIADVLEFDQCRIELSETLAGDINEADPFETTYMYGRWHIEETLIPELENLIRLAGGDATIEGTIDGNEETVRLSHALYNWNKQLSDSDRAQKEAFEENYENRSFSGGTEFTYSHAHDRTDVVRDVEVTVFFELEVNPGAVWTIGGLENHIYGVIIFESEKTVHYEETEGAATTTGYVLGDEDAGDYFSVDVAKREDYGTYAFRTVSGRSSNPWEENTQKRDNPIILVDPPVMYNVPDGEWGSFEVTLINASESDERRLYTMQVPGETNPNNLIVTVTGDILGGARLETWLLDPGKALTINMDVSNSACCFEYEDVGVVLYPADEYDIWLGDTRQPFVLSDTAWFSVYFDSTGGNALAATMTPGWNWFSINRPGGTVESVMESYPATHGDVIRHREATSKYDSLAGWMGSLTELKPGVAYRLLAHERGLLRIKGEPVDPTTPMQLKAGWNSVGFLPSKRMPVGEALASLNDRLVEGDAVVGQHRFAQFVNGMGWVGTLTDMEPGDAYDLFLAGNAELTYPEPPEKTAPRPPTRRETTILGPEWTVKPGDYDTYMTVVAELRKNETPLEHTAFKVAVTENETVRGVGEVRYVEDLDQFLAFIQIYGAPDEETDLKVHVYDGERDALYEDIGTVKFVAQTMLGQPSSPVHLEMNNAGQAPEVLDIPEEFALYDNYPNPFNPITVIGYDLPTSEVVSLVVYDIMGRQVARLVDGEQAAGRHRAVFDGTVYASGLYLYRMDSGAFTGVGKMILVK